MKLNAFILLFCCLIIFSLLKAQNHFLKIPLDLKMRVKNSLDSLWEITTLSHKLQDR